MMIEQEAAMRHDAPTADEEWDRLTKTLALALYGLGEVEYLIVSSKPCDRHTNLYVQFAGQGRSGMRAEAVSNVYIEPPEARLSADDCAAMVRLGWEPPTNRPPEEHCPTDDSHGSPNFFRDWPFPVDYEALAAVTTRTFREVYRIRLLGELEYTAFARNGTQIRFPNLCIDAAQPLSRTDETGQPATTDEFGQELTDQEVLAQRCDIQMMQRPHLWPRRPYLPLKRKGSGKRDELRFLKAGSGPTVFSGNIFSIMTGKTPPPPSGESFDSFAAISAAGWRVD